MLENPESETRWYFKYFLGKGICHTQGNYLYINQMPFFPLEVLIILGSLLIVLYCTAVMILAVGNATNMAA